MHTMLTDLETPRSATRRTHRTYSREFKAQLVAACQPPGTSIAALAGCHGMNANVLHRWLKEHARSGCHQVTLTSSWGAGEASTPRPQFLPLQLPAQAIEQTPPVIKIELRKGAVYIGITWSTTAAVDCAAWMRELLR